MKVLHLVSEKTWRGGEQQVAYLIEELEKHSVESHVICRKGSSFEKYCQQHGLPHLALSFSKVFPFPTASGIMQYANKHQVDIIHMHTSHAHTVGVLAHLAGAKARLILSRRVEFAIGQNLFSRFKYNYQGIERILCVSEKVRTLMADSIKDASKCTVVYDGISLERFKQYDKTNSNFLKRSFSIDPQYKLIGTVAAIDNDKDYYTFLDAAKIIKEAHVKAKFIIVGTGPLKNEIEQYAAAIGLSQDVVFTGFINNVNEVLPEFDLFLFTSLKEGLGSTILDAFACRVPVISTNVGGIPEMILHGESGFLVPIKQPELIAKYALELLQKPELISKFTQNAAQKVLQFTKEKTAERTLAVYKEVLS